MIKFNAIHAPKEQTSTLVAADVMQSVVPSLLTVMLLCYAVIGGKHHEEELP